MSTERTILSNLFFNDEYARKVLAYLDPVYFSEITEKSLFNTFKSYWDRYNMAPTKEALILEVGELDNLNDDQYGECVEIIEEMINEESNIEWLVETTESWCQEMAIQNALMDSLSIVDGTDKKRTKHSIPDILKEALAVSFNTHVGHDYVEDSDDRYDSYHLETSKLPFDIEVLNDITNGGVEPGTLNIVMAATNVGKTLNLIHFSSGYLKAGKNVLYISLEISEEKIGNRIDANLFDLDMNLVPSISKDKYQGAINRLASKTSGKLVIKQYPTSSAHVGHFRILLQELWLKKNFKPDVICVDYINIMSSSTVKKGSVNSYTYVKYMAEELRALAVEYGVPIWSATQANRGGYDTNDMDLTNTSESIGLPETADFMIGAMRTDELDNLNQILFKQLKSRYGDKNVKNRFLIGSEFNKQKLFNVENQAQKEILDYDTSNLSNQKENPSKSKNGITKIKRNKFKDYS